jgi:type VI secretion system protein ImpA
LVARLATVVRTLPLTANGFSLAQYEESRAVGYQEDADSSEKEESRNAAIAAKKLTAEQFDSAAARSGQTYYQDLLSQIDGCIENLATLSRVCRQHFERSCPGFGALETPLARLRATTAKFSSAIPYSESVKSSEPEDSNVEREEEETEAPARSSRLSGSRPATGPDEQPPPDRETAFQRILALAEFLRKDDIADPAPYLLVRAMHTGRLRADLAHDPERACIAPASETRRRLLTLSREQQWDDVLREGEEAAAKACGSAWMDVQWYVYKAASELNYETLASALESAAAALIADLPRLSDLMLADGTPAAGFETRQWLIRLTRDVPSVLRQEAASAEPEEESLGGLSPDPYELAMEAMRNGRVADAVGVLWCDSVQAPSGRERFLGRIETARLLMRAGSHRIALPLLDEIAEEIEARRLHQWEPSDVIGGALQLQLQCATALHCPAEQLERIFARMCRVDPVRAMGDGKESHAAGL